jgi:hypothetical protein
MKGALEVNDKIAAVQRACKEKTIDPLLHKAILEFITTTSAAKFQVSATKPFKTLN